MKARTAYRVARSNAHASLQRALGDPARGARASTPRPGCSWRRALTGAILEVDARLSERGRTRCRSSRRSPRASTMRFATWRVPSATAVLPLRTEVTGRAGGASSGPGPVVGLEAAGRMVDSVETMLRLEAGPSTGELGVVPSAARACGGVRAGLGRATLDLDDALCRPGASSHARPAAPRWPRR